MKHQFLSLFVALVFFSFAPLTAQVDHYPDSLKSVVEDGLLPDSIRVEAAYNLTYYYLDRDDLRCMPVAEKALALAEVTKDTSWIVKTSQAYGHAARSVGRMQDAKKGYKRAAAISYEQDDDNSVSRAETMLAVVYIRTGQLDTAELHLDRALNAAFSLADSFLISQVLSRYGLLNIEKGNVQAALDSTLRAFTWAPDHPGLKNMLYTNMCAICNDGKLYEQGLEYCGRGLAYAEELDSPDAVVRFLNNYGEIYRGMGEVEESRTVLQRALEIVTEPFSRLYTLNGLGIANHLLGQTSSGIEQLREALVISDSLDAMVERAVTLDHLARIHVDLKQYRISHDYAVEAMNLLDELGGDPIQETELMVNYLIARTELGLPVPPERMRHYLTLRDSLFSNQHLAELAQATERFRVAEARAENAELALDNANKESQLKLSRQRLYGLTGLLLLFLGGGIFLNYLRRRNARLAEENANLYSELNHRTNDNLDVMVRLLRHRKNEAIAANQDPGPLRDIERQITVFTLLQNMLRKTDGTHVNLRTYLSDLTDLLETSMIREEGRLDVDLECPNQEVKAEFATTLGLIINEHITNSIKYGKRKEDVLHVTLSVREVGGQKLEVLYHDAGPADRAISDNLFSNNLGLGLIDEFTDQLKGNKLPTDEQYNYRVEFPAAMI